MLYSHNLPEVILKTKEDREEGGDSPFNGSPVWLADKVSSSCFCQCLSYPSAYVVYLQYTYMYICTYVYICMYVYTYIRCVWLADKVSSSCFCQCLSYPSAYVVYLQYVCTYICMYVCTYVRMYVYVHTYVCMLVHVLYVYCKKCMLCMQGDILVGSHICTSL